MSDNTAIEWTHRPGTTGATLNALVGCQKVSEGCRSCYAIETAHIRAGNPLPIIRDKFAGTTAVAGGSRVWTGKVTFTERAILKALAAVRPRTYFVNALSDLFYEGVPTDWVDKHFAMFALTPHHTHLILTKRPERMAEYLSSPSAADRIMRVAALMAAKYWPGNRSLAPGFLWRAPEGEKWRPGDCYIHPDKFIWPLPNVWVGTSVENQQVTNQRVPHLLNSPAVVRYLSVEPMLGYIELPPVDWIICGGESKQGRSPARPMDPDWARALRDQCVTAGVPFFFKQWGHWGPCENGEMTPNPEDCDVESHTFTSSKPRSAWEVVYAVGKKVSGNILDGRKWNQFPVEASQSLPDISETAATQSAAPVGV